ncbi:MAG: DNA mismatch repair endonuclease MutL [Chloroflexota bacterium]
MPITILHKDVVSQIAAGEVVERPASVVKELVENSLDAGSRQISVEVVGGGVSLLRVTDDGGGIPAGEVALAFERHATSKITGLSDLYSISSLGFRGEALPSIAAVAEVDILTCAVGETAGTHLSLEGGTIASRASEGRTRGTTVTVRHLFRRVPARLKFLKSSSTEGSHVANVVSQYALAFPEVAFTLLLDGRLSLKTAGRGRLIDSVIEVYGVETAASMLAVKSAAEGEYGAGPASPEVTGLAGAPSVSRSGRGALSFFVNRRWVNSRLLARAVEEAYHGLLMVGRHPVAVINISLPPQEVDVNIHPAKSEVKFQSEQAVFAAVQRAVRRALVAQMPVPQVGEAVPEYGAPALSRAELWPQAEAGHHANPSAVAAPPLAVSLPVLRVLGQLVQSYIVAEGPDGLYLIDQHAAHERILFEQVRQQWRQQGVEVQGLLEPVTFEVSPRQAAVWQSLRGSLAEFGFSVEPFGERTYLVRAVPGLLRDGDWAAALRELLDSFSGEVTGDWGEEIAKSIACHSAVRAAQTLTDDEMGELVRQLEQAANPHTCPHGRPTMVHISLAQLRRELGRMG